MSRLLPGLILFLLLVHCNSDPPINPNGFQGIEMDIPDTNPFSSEGIELGRRLFYDQRLSSNGRVSCATCHMQELAFSDGTARSPHGVSGTPLDRHAPTLTNAGYLKFLFWDGGARNLESQALTPLTHAEETGMDLDTLISILTLDPDYPTRFKMAFGTDSIYTANILRALAQFQRTLVSNQAPIDRFWAGEYELNKEQRHGQNLFEKHCSSCHTPPLFADNKFHNNGLDSIFSSEKEGIYTGRYRITLDSNDIGKFKTPTLRNIFLTAPYMHDGRFQTLDEVLDHYSNGIRVSETLNPSLWNGIPLTEQERTALLDYLQLLTDSLFIQNQRFSNPL